MQLKFRTTDGFLGYKAYYENGNLVFRFNSPPVVSGGSLSGVRISIDPGHCSTDPGALGFLSDYPEQYITKNVSKYLKDELTSRGAQVYMTNTQNGYVSLESRMSQAKSIVPHVVISVHANSAASASAKGSEGWYFNSFSRNLAAQASSKISSALGTTNRGAKEGLFYMTRDSEFAGILMEYGFVTNSDDYYKMIEDSYQRKLASATADAIYSFLANMGSNGATGTESTGSSSGSGGGSSSSSSGEQSSTSASSSEENSGSSGSGVEATILVEGAERNSSGSGFNLRLSEYMYVLDYELESEEEIGTVSWVSTNTDVAEIDKNGALVLKQTGSTTLRLLIDGQIVDYCTIRVQ